MSRITKWKIEKPKVKVVFRLQFHASHIPQPGWDKLFVSFIPADSGKVTAKTSKANVRNGNCKWSDPIYETTRLLQDAKTRKYDEKFYKLVVAMGSSRSSILGEANINLADYADASKPFSVALPLHGCNSVTVLHVTIQLLTSKTGFREFEQQRELREKGFHTINDQSLYDEPAEKESSSLEPANDHIEKVNARVRFRPDFRELPSLEEEEELNEDYTDSAVGADGSSHTSESLYAEKHDISSTNEIDSLKSPVSVELSGYSSSQSPQAEKGNGCGSQPLLQGSIDHGCGSQPLLQGSIDHGWGSDYSMYNELATAYEENTRLRGCLEVAEATIQELRLELGTLQNQVDELGTETQSFNHQLLAEITSGEELARAVSILKSELSRLKDELEGLKHSEQSRQFTATEAEPFGLSSPYVQAAPAGGKCSLSEGGHETDAVIKNQDCLLYNLQMKWQRDLLLIEDKVREIQKEASIKSCEKDLHFFHPDLEVLGSLLQDLKDVTAQLFFLLNSKLAEGGVMTILKSEQFFPGSILEGRHADTYISEPALHSFSRPGQESPEYHLMEDNLGATFVMKEKIGELLSEVEESKAERENLIKKMDQMECYYEELIQELEESQRQMLEELQKLRNEHSTCLYTITAFKSQVETMRQDMNEQLVKFAEDRHGLDSLNKEFEKRAIASETSLKRLRLNYSIAVSQLQKDLELLSFQVLSMFETNENLARQALAETSQLCFQDHMEEHSEESHTGVGKDDSETALLKEKYKSKVQAFKAGIGIPWKQGNLSMEFSGPPVRLNYKTRHCLDNVVNDKGIFSKGVPMHVETITKDEKSTLSKLWAPDTSMDALREGDTGIDGIRLENVRHVAFPHSFIQERNSELLADLVAEPKQQLDAGILLEDVKRSLQLQEELHQKAEAELSEMHLLNLHLEVFSKVLQETLHEANDGVRLTEKKMEEQVQQLECLTESEELLMLKLQAVMDDVKVLGESEGKRITGCDDLAAKNNTLEAKLQYMSDENDFLAQKVTKWDDLTAENTTLEAKCDDLTAKNHALEAELQHISDKNVFLAQEVTKWDNLTAKNTTLEVKCDDLTAKNHALEAELQHISDENGFLAEKVTQCETLLMECGNYKSRYEACTAEKSDLENLLEHLRFERLHLEGEISFMREELVMLKAEFDRQSSAKGDLERTLTFMQDRLGELRSSMVSYSKQIDGLAFSDKSPHPEEEEDFKTTFLHLEEFQQKACEQILKLSKEKKDVEEQRDAAQGSLSSAESKILFMKQKFEFDIKDMVTKLDLANMHGEKLQLELQDAEYKLQHSLEAEEKRAVQSRELSSKLAFLEAELQQVASEKRDFALKVQTLDSINEELERTKLALINYTQENEALIMSLQAGNEDSLQLASELSSLKESLRCAHQELLSERGSRDELEAQVKDITSQLNEKDEQMSVLSSQGAELVHLRQQVSDLELEKLKLRHLLFQSKQCRGKIDEEASLFRLQVADLEMQLATMHESLLASDIETIFIRHQLMATAKDLVNQLDSLERSHVDLHSELWDAVSTLNACMASKARCAEENAELMTSLQSLRSELETIVVEKKELADYVDQKSAMWAELENYNGAAAAMEVENSEQKRRHDIQIEQLKSRLVNYDEEMDNLRSSRDEEEIKVIVLKSKLDELHAQVLLLQEYGNELIKLRNENKELTNRLCEQIMKTEEFKNLSIHLKELKDRADAESSQAREKREIEGPSGAMQESLRIAFIREQCETKLQEVRSQLYVSKKHGEEMLLKLQDALDEIENRKKSEASQAKRNEELSKKILELETELQAVAADRRERVKVYDRMKAELECTMLSLDCCKEEKLMLEASLQECNEERTKIAVEFNLMKEQLESSTSPPSLHEKGYQESSGTNSLCIQSLLESDHFMTSKVQSQQVNTGVCYAGSDMENAVAANGVNKMDSMKSLDDSIVLSSYQQMESASSVSIDEGNHATSQIVMQTLEDSLAVKSVPEVLKLVLKEKDGLVQSDKKYLALSNEHFKDQILKTSMERLHKELERMKRENLTSILQQDEHHPDPTFPDFQKELLQLHMANERLGSIFPSFNEFPGSGNALERVLALEIELAESLQVKKKSSIHFQSSFLKQHKDDEAVFKSFRDINEVIKDMLEMKRKYSTVENELKEMHERYSQLSVQFAEVEGERQKLVMTLKNIRPAKKT